MEETNKLIAIFMGAKYCNDDTKEFPKGYYMHDKFDGLESKDLCFHSSWDWLIPVINKIYSINDYYIYKHKTSGQFENEVFINTKFIEVTYESVVEFIQWYNDDKNNR